MLPGMDGFEVCRRIRKASDTPVLMLSARGDVMDRIIGFEIGADDYLPKPFEPRELVARIHSILKRVQVDEHINEHSNCLQWEHLLIDSCSRTAFVDQRDLNLTEKEFSLLLLVAENVDKTFSRDEIIHRLNGVDAELFSRAVDILVSRVRQKLEPIKCIQTVRGVGYRFVPPKKAKV